MIVVDANVIAYLLIPGKFTAAAEAWLLEDPQWAAPVLWRSEVRNILATYMRVAKLELSDARSLYARAADILQRDEYEVDTADVLRLARASACSAYDCEYIALAEALDVPLLTADAKLIKAFPARTVALMAA